MIKCSCGNPKCSASIQTQKEGITVHTKKGENQLIYLDANSMVILIVELQAAIKEKTNA